MKGLAAWGQLALSQSVQLDWRSGMKLVAGDAQLSRGVRSTAAGIWLEAQMRGYTVIEFVVYTQKESGIRHASSSTVGTRF